MYNNNLAVLDELFKHNGVVKSPVDVTPTLGSRQAEIERYIMSNADKIQSFVILDDAEINIYPEHFVRCDIEKGLKANLIKERIIEILNKH